MTRKTIDQKSEGNQKGIFHILNYKVKYTLIKLHSYQVTNYCVIEKNYNRFKVHPKTGDFSGCYEMCESNKL